MVSRGRGRVRSVGPVPGENGIPFGFVDPGVSVSQARRHVGSRRTVRVCTAVMIVLSVCLALCLWAAGGLAMRAGLLPYFDAGYTWFDERLFVFFGL